MLRILIVFVAAPLLSSCFSYRAASAGAVGCPPEEIEIRDQRVTPGLSGPTRTWTAICRERQHQCSAGSAPYAAECREVFARDPHDSLDDYRIARGFDAQRQEQTIEARLRIDVRRSLDLYSVPAGDPKVRATVRLLARRDVPCDAVRFIANSTTVTSALVGAQREGSTQRLEAELGEELLRELRRPHPTLVLEGCGQTLTLDERAMAALGEFTRMYDDLANQEGKRGGLHVSP